MTQPLHVVCPRCDAVNRVPSERLGDEAKCGKCRGPLFAGAPLALDEGRFPRHLGRSDLPLVVDFWAPWCGPCRAMAPAFEAVARRIEPRARLVKVNTEENQGLAMRYGIRSIPTLVIFTAGKEVARTSGAMDAGSLENWIRRAI
ncbi:MAG: thioredoxin TrxC [Gammaproteobacteria bacterium]|nr:thioredoxin TrxC [Candidatus Thioaporhodococcus sediminis]TNF56376.1 MAG: thioredoxin TrxC [Gammaproteobacteria bacterium]